MFNRVGLLLFALVMGAKPAPISLCHLFQSLKEFHGKELEVRGVLGETLGLTDPDCRVGPVRKVRVLESLPRPGQ